jgi:leucyl aminopeptidase
MTPLAFAAAARKMASGRRLRVRVLPEATLRRLKMGSLLGVAQGSSNPPCLVVAEYRGGRGAPIALVGKGVMFDTGGISIKPADGMDKMKMDMCGGAGVLGAIRAAADLRLPLNVVAVVPAVENMPDGNAQRPGDIVRACNGVTIEVLNTDAEGRLILADALAWTAKTHRPRAMVDMATLTGAVVIALGRHCMGVMGTDAKLVRGLIDAGESAGERAWELPLWDEYVADAKSPIADIKNIGPPRQAGTIMGAAFLKYFVGETPWAHLDIAAVAWHESGPAIGPTGAGVRLLTEFLCREAGRRKGGKK